jgi:uncharacterized protein YjeT (DUF2065 family)
LADVDTVRCDGGAGSEKFLLGSSERGPTLLTGRSAVNLETLVSIIGMRAGSAGLMLVLAPRLLRRVLLDFTKMSDNELRIIGYVLLGTGATVLAQKALKRSLLASLAAPASLERGEVAPEAAPIH